MSTYAYVYVGTPVLLDPRVQGNHGDPPFDLHLTVEEKVQ